MSAGFALLQRFLREVSGYCVEDDKRYLVEDRLGPLLRGANLGGLDELARYIHGNGRSELARQVTEALTINETSFFRDRALFTAFADRLLPQLIAAREETRRLRIWCAGCSSGQEPYSIAMVLDEKQRQLSGWQVEIVATDLSRRVVDLAQRGVYSQFEVQRGLPVSLLLRHFGRQGESWQISDYLRAKVSFRAQNLMTIPRDMGRFDVIFCRNVLIYFDAETKKQVLHGLTGAMAPDGFLALGGAERVGGLTLDLRPEASTPFVFVPNRTLAPA